MNKQKVLKLRAMQTAGATIEEIAKKLDLNPSDVEAKLIELGYVPNEKVTPEPHEWSKKEEEAPPQKSYFFSEEEINNVVLMYDYV